MLLERDKILHIIAGSILATFAFFVSIIYLDLYTSMLVGGGVAIVLGAAKEVIYDRVVPGHVSEFNDFLATAVSGCVTASVLYILMQQFK